MAISVERITKEQAAKLLALEEGHFADLKAVEIQPAKLTQTLSAFANADGGELYVGIAEMKPSRFYGSGSCERAYSGFGGTLSARSRV
jgi:ATP-dependent DNA helicase RecG